MNRLKKIIVFGFILATLLMIMIPAQAFAKEKELYVTANEIYMNSGSAHKLATIYDGQQLFFISSDPRVATVDEEGRIQALSKGRTTIFVRTMSGMGLNNCEVYVDIEPEIIEEPEIPKTHFYQADMKWCFTEITSSRACVLTSMAMLLKNSGIETNPKDTFRRNGRRRGMTYNRVLEYYDKQYDCAVPYNSEYLLKYTSDNGMTKIVDPEVNYEAAITEALERHPEGVLCYFINRRGKHAIVATSVEDGVIYYNDPGRRANKGEHVTFEDTWCGYRHKMDYGDLAYLIAIN